MDIIEVFKNWFGIKIKLWQKLSSVVFKQNEILWCSIGIDVGEEVFGKGRFFLRPVLIFKKFTSNSFLGLPLTTQDKEGNWYIGIQTSGKKRVAILNQARILDKKRLVSRLGVLSDSDCVKVKDQFLKLYTN